MDAYLFLYFSEFLTLRELVLYTRTSKLYREKLIIDNIEKRFKHDTYATISSYISGDTKIQLTSYTETNGRNTMIFSAKNQIIEYDIHSKDICIEVPGWRFSWCDINDLMLQEYVKVRVAETPFAKIVVLLNRDRLNRCILIDEIQISYEPKMGRWLWRHRVKRYVLCVCLMCIVIVATYKQIGICILLSLVCSGLSLYFTRKIHPSYFEIYPEVGET